MANVSTIVKRLYDEFVFLSPSTTSVDYVNNIATCLLELFLKEDVHENPAELLTLSSFLTYAEKFAYDFSLFNKSTYDCDQVKYLYPWAENTAMQMISLWGISKNMFSIFMSAFGDDDEACHERFVKSMVFILISSVEKDLISKAKYNYLPRIEQFLKYFVVHVDSEINLKVQACVGLAIYYLLSKDHTNVRDCMRDVIKLERNNNLIKDVIDSYVKNKYISPNTHQSLIRVFDDLCLKQDAKHKKRLSK